MYLTLLDKTIKSYIWLGIVLYVILLLFWKDSFTYYNVLNIFTFATYAFLLWTSANKPDEYYTNKRLGWTVFLYSLFFVGNYMYMCDYYKGNTFLFSEADSLAYENYSLRMAQMPIEEWIPFLISKRWGYDDWGAPFFQALFKIIFPSKYFINYIYILLGILSSILMFSTGKQIMNIKHAYMAALSFAIGSYCMYFYGTYLKEIIMVCIVLSCFRLFYKFLENENVAFMILTISLSLPLFFFRPVVAMFIWLAISTTFFYGKKDKAYFLFIIIFLLVIARWSSFAAVEASENYIHNGDIQSTANYVSTSTFGILTSSISAMVGPFPNLYHFNNRLNPTAIFGAGLLFKFLLIIPFYKGFTFAIRNKIPEVIPLFAFCFIEMVSLAVVNDGLELRKAFPHVPIFILAAFWFINKYDENVTQGKMNTKYNVWYNRLFNICILVAFVSTFFWTAIRQ